jgi:steroid 5-alpha reductase family enzyme
MPNKERGWSFAKTALLLVFSLQFALGFFVALPVQLGQQAGGLGPLAWAGAALAVVGVAFETVGDWQLTRFKADAANAGKVMDRACGATPAIRTISATPASGGGCI